jgi:rhamnogalacturonyl hydrolase YesR
MRTLQSLRGNLGKLALKSAGALWPPNLIVVARNARDRRRVEPWLDFVARTSDPEATLRESLEWALRWIVTSQDRIGTGGVGSYEFYGWTPGFPEVTGYIIPTVWDCRHVLDREELAHSAVRMADWELGIQKEEGGWEGDVEGAKKPPIVFNTGQVVRGLLRTHQETGEGRYLEASVRASDWIVSNQEKDGSWTLANFMQMKRVYDSYVTPPLARLGSLTGNDAYTGAAIRNCEFVLRHQRENGWFDLCDNTPYFNDAPTPHTICYTIDGLLETGELVGREDFVAAGTKAADALMRCIEPSGVLRGRFDDQWRAQVRWSCLTGCAQLGIIMMKLHARSGEERYRDAARRLADFLIYVQRLNGVGPNRGGALPGSYPIWGPYAPLKYPCWATKFLIDFFLLMAAPERKLSPSSSPVCSSSGHRSTSVGTGPGPVEASGP